VQLKNINDLDDLEKLALINMSYSRLDSYDMCPSKYFYTYIQKEERFFGAAAALGNVLHGVLEDVVGEDIKYAKMLELLDSHRDTYDPEKKIDDTLMDAGRHMLADFADRHRDEKFEIIGKEQGFQIIIGTALVTGYIDLVTRGPNGIMVTDYKSGKYEVSQKSIPNNLQLGIYALAASIMFPGENIYAELYYLRTGRRKGHLFLPSELDTVHEVVLEKINAIIEDMNFTASPGRYCSFCDFAKSGVCKTGVRFNYRG
jgi:RecB family exonuclease